MKKIWIIVILVYIATILLFIFLPNNKSISGESPEIDSLYVIKDSIIVEIDTVYLKIENTKIEYEKERNTIINNDVYDDYIFFNNYLKSRFDSIDNM